MNLELNIVGSTGIYSRGFTLVGRSRKVIENPTEVKVLNTIKSFIDANMDVLQSAVADKAFLDNISKDTEFNVDKFYSVKYVLATYGIDILAYEVANEEVNPESIEGDNLEYNLVDKSDRSTSFLPFVTKIVTTKDAGLYDVYSKIDEMYEFFKGSAFENMKTPIKSGLNTLKQVESINGVTPLSLTNYLNSVLEYLGKELIVINN